MGFPLILLLKFLAPMHCQSYRLVKIVALFWFLLLIFQIGGFDVKAQTAILSGKDIFRPEIANQGMFVGSEPIASEIALEVLKNGGNAIDAAVTAGFVMAVTFPRAGNIGGGGFMLVYLAKEKKVVAIDYREKAPRSATKNMFLDDLGNVDSTRSRFSHLSAGVPGTVAGLALALKKYGTLSLSQALAPAIKLAEKGMLVDEDFSDSLKQRAKSLKKWKASKKIFFGSNDKVPEPGERFFQKDLANTLQDISDHGVNSFYKGKTAKLITREMKKHGGLINARDLAEYRPTIRKPVSGMYRGFEIFSMSPPSSGGVHIIQILNILEGFNIKEKGHNSAATIHLMVEAMKRAYADRSKYLGDTDFVQVPLKGLTSKKYAAALGTDIRKGITMSPKISPGEPVIYESPETTHFSVVDRFGNAVSNTYTLNFSFGSGIVVDGAGFLLNNEMDDFSAKPGVPNAYGLIGGAANAIEPEKRMLSSMSPTIVIKENKPLLVTGSPGGSRIITTVLQVIMNVIDHQMNIQEAVNAPRIHHQWFPDEIRVEKGINKDTFNLLQKMGYQIAEKNSMGAAASILIDSKNRQLHGAADPRRRGKAMGYSH